MRQHLERIHIVRPLLTHYKVDYYLVPSNDEFMGEYVPPCNARLEYLTGFRGSNGVAAIGNNHQDYFFTDGRYLLQAKKELDNIFEIQDIQAGGLDNWVINTIKDKKVALNSDLFSITQVENWQKYDHNDNLVFTILEYVAMTWAYRPSWPLTEILIHDIQYSGQTMAEKLEIVMSFLEERGAEAVVLTDPHSVCWLLNIRGHDLEFTPIILCNAVVYKNGAIKLFAFQSATGEATKYLAENNVEVRHFNTIYDELRRLKNKVCISKNSPHAIAISLSNYTIDLDPCAMPRACKNETEIKGAIKAHIKDGNALRKCLAWLENAVHNQQVINELSVDQKLLEFRKEQENFFSPSFGSVVGFKENGAIIHYRPTLKSAKDLKGDGLLLIDSGGQYLEGTTDVTRVIAIGTPTAEQIHDFTLVLKGHISVASAVFLEGTTGADLDALARAPLRQEGKNYAHGTGHGVGSFLSVHEGPQSLNALNKIPLLPNMIVSIEPGFYREGEYGIRIENLAYIKKSKTAGHLEFVMLTKVPIDERLIDFSMLTSEEKAWVEKYNHEAMAIPVSASNP